MCVEMYWGQWTVLLSLQCCDHQKVSISVHGIMVLVMNSNHAFIIHVILTPLNNSFVCFIFMLQEPTITREAGGSWQIQCCHEDGDAMDWEDGGQGGSSAINWNRTRVSQATDGSVQG